MVELPAKVSKMMKSQGGLIAEDRRALLAEQNASMERLVSIISATVNRDLPLRMEEIVRAEVQCTFPLQNCWSELASCHHVCQILVV